jgi:hypothetical protein
MDVLKELRPNLALDIKTKTPSIAVGIAEGLRLPEDMRTNDFREIVEDAQQYLGCRFPATVLVVDRLFTHRGEVSAMLGGDKDNVQIALSLARAHEKLQYAADFPYARMGSVREQLIASAGEEAIHAGRIILDVFDPNYFSPPNNATEDEEMRYLEQPEEVLVNEALNGGLLQRRIGPDARRIGKFVVHVSPGADVSEEPGAIEAQFIEHAALPNLSSKTSQ